MNNKVDFYNDIAIELIDKKKEIDSISFPSTKQLKRLLQELRIIIFPYFFRPTTTQSNISKYLKNIEQLLQKQISREFSPSLCRNRVSIIELSHNKARQFIERIPKIQKLLHTDIVAAYNGDPAARNYTEIILCYPSIYAITYYRI